MERFSISVPEKLLVDFDRYIAKRGYENRSEAVRDLMRAAFIKEQWEKGSEVVGVVTIVFDHHQKQLQDRLTKIQHDYGSMVISATHVHLDHHNCLEVVIVRGKAGKVQEIADRIKSVRGVIDSSLSMSCCGKGIV